MKREEQLKFCKKCTNRAHNFKKGTICRLTNKIADFEGECENFSEIIPISEKNEKFEGFQRNQIIRKEAFRLKRKKIIKRLAIITLFLVVISVVLAIVFKPKHEKWQRIEQIYLDDFNGDDKKQEMLIIYKPCYYESHRPCESQNAMRLINIETEEEIWTSVAINSFVHASKRIALVDSIITIAYSDNTLFRNKDKVGVEAFSSKTGKKLWEHKFDSLHRFGPLNWIRKNKNSIYIFSEKQYNSICITSLDINNGQKKWETSIKSSYSYKSISFINDKMIFNLRSRVFEIDLKTGKKINIAKNTKFGNPIILNDKSFLYFEDNKLFKYDTAKVALKDFFRHEREYVNSYPFFDMLSIYNDNLIYFFSTENGAQIKQASITSTSNKTFEFENGFYFNEYLFSIVHVDEEINSYTNIENRFIPIALMKGENEKTTNKLVIFDLDSNQIFQETNLVIEDIFRFSFNRLFYYKGYYTLLLDSDPLKTTSKHWIVSISAKTGKFKNAIRLKTEQYNTYPNYRHGSEIFANNYFCGTDETDAWCLSFPDLEIIFSTNDELKTIDVKYEIEELFGKMIWE